MFDIWNKIIPNLREYFGNPMFDAWLSSVSLNKIENDTLFLVVQSNLVKDYVENKFAEQIIEYAKYYDNTINNIQIAVDANIDTKSQNHQDLSLDIFKSSVNPNFTFDNFIVGKSNKICYESAKSLADNDNISFNPLYIYGGVGLGKTHLMHSIYWHNKNINPRKSVIYMSAESFMYRFISAIRNKDSDNFKNTLRSVDILMIDDIQFISDRESTQIELAHTINTLFNSSKQIVLSADCLHSELSGFSSYLKSRFAGGLAVNICPTTYQLRIEILKSKIDAMKACIPTEVIEFLAQKITSNIRELEGALQRIISYVNYINPNIDIYTAYTLLQDMLENSSSIILSFDDIAIKVCEYYKIDLSDMYSKSRLKSLVRCRQIAIYLCRKLTQLSVASIARHFQNRDVTTIIYSVKIIEKLIKENKQAMKDIKCLEQIIQRK